MATRNIRLYCRNCIESRPGRYTAVMDTAELSNLKGIAIKACTFDNNVYNIYTEGSRKNNVFNFEVLGSATGSVTIAESGFYSASQLIAIIQPVIEAALQVVVPATTLTMAIGANNSKIEYTISSPGVTLLLPGALGFGGLNLTLGNTIDSGNITSAAKYTSNTFTNLRGLRSVTVSIKSKTPKTILNTNAKPIHTNSLAVIPVTVPYLSQQTYINPDISNSILLFSNAEDLTSTQISLRDPDGNVLEDQSNALLIELIGFL